MNGLDSTVTSCSDLNAGILLKCKKPVSIRRGIPMNISTSAYTVKVGKISLRNGAFSIARKYVTVNMFTAAKINAK